MNRKLASALKRAVPMAGALMFTVGALSACSVTISDDAKEQGKSTICQSSQSAIRQLDAGDETAKLAAILIRDNVEAGSIKDSADRVAKGKGTKAEREQLIEWIKSECA